MLLTDYVNLYHPTARWRFIPAPKAVVAADTQMRNGLTLNNATKGTAIKKDVATSVRRVVIARQTLTQVRSQIYHIAAASAGRTVLCSAGAVVLLPAS